MEEEKKRIESQAREQIQKLQDERQKMQTEKKAQLARVAAQMTDVVRRLDPNNEADRQEFRRVEPILEMFASFFPETFVKKYELKFFWSCMYPLAFLCAFESKESLREHVFDLLPEAADEALCRHCEYNNNFLNPPMMKWLLTKRPDMVSKSDLSGYLLLHHACDRGKDLQVIKLLVEANPESVNTKTDGGDFPIELALKRSSIEVVQYLMERHDPKPKEELFLQDDGFPLQCLLDNTDLDVMKYIFEMFPSLLTTQLPPRNGSPLHYVLLGYGCPDDGPKRVALLLKLCGSAASMKDEDGQIPLQIALQHGDRLDDETLVDLVRAYPETMDAMDETTGKPIVDLPTSKRISKFCLAASQNGPHASTADVERPRKKAPQNESRDATTITDDALPKKTVRTAPQNKSHAAGHVERPKKKIKRNPRKSG